MNLNLKRPIIIYDLETTGLDIAADRIVELAYLKVLPDGTEHDHRYLFNPGRPISPEATEVHHITDEMVQNCPPFSVLAQTIAADFRGSDLAGYNSDRFDTPMLIEEFVRAGVDPSFLKEARQIDVQKIFFRMEPRTLEAALLFYCGRRHQDAHSALGDVRATYDVLRGELDKYADLKNDVAYLAEFSAPDRRRVDATGRMVYDAKGQIVFDFGKYRGQSVEWVLRTKPGYYEWIMNGDFSGDFKRELTRIKLSLK